MELASFDESNAVLGKPPDMTHEECQTASVWKGKDQGGYPVVITCWKVTQEELEEIQRTGRVWLVITGHTMPPSFVSGKYPFNKG